jgi:hypothetical protein
MGIRVSALTRRKRSNQAHQALGQAPSGQDYALRCATPSERRIAGSTDPKACGSSNREARF